MKRATKTVLVVDDDPAIAEMLGLVVSDAGHEAVICRDGADALAQYVGSVPDLVMLDSMLPRVPGPEVCRQIKRLPIGRLTPVLVFSGVATDSRKALAAGAEAFFAKPFTSQELFERLHAFLPGLPEPEGDGASAPGSGEQPLSSEPLPAALGRLSRSRATGVLTVRSLGRLKHLLLEAGEVVQVRSQGTATAVTGMLLARGRLSQERLPQLEARAASRGKPLSELLVEEGVVLADELRALVLGRMLQEIFEAFRWTDGSLSFAAGKLQAAGQLRLSVPVTHLVLWGLRKIAPGLEELDRLVPSRSALLVRTRDGDALLKGLHFTADERRTLRLLDGTRSVQDVIAAEGTEAAPLLCALLCLSAVSAAPARSGPPVPEASHAASRDDVFSFTELEGPDMDTVPRADYERLLAEKTELERRIAALDPDSARLHRKAKTGK